MRKIISLFVSLIIISGVCFASSDAILAQARTYREEAYRLQSSGRLDEALALYTKALSMDPEYFEIYNDLGVIYEMQGDLNAAEKMYLKVIDFDKSYLPVYANLGFLYEKKRDVQRAGYYWRKRYELGEEGEYWREVARQHLIELGTMQEILDEIREKEALELSKTLVYEREQKRLQTIEEAKMHFEIGMNALNVANFEQAIREFNTVLKIDADDAVMNAKAADYLKQATIEELASKIDVKINKSEGFLKEKDYLSLMMELRNALELVSKMPVESIKAKK